MNLLPGGITFGDSLSADNRIQSIFDVNLRLDHLLGDMQDLRERINRAFFVDLFTMLSGQNDPKKTAYEVAKMHEEKLLILGPTLLSLKGGALDPLFDIVFAAMLENGMLPPPPPELQGHVLEIELVGVLAQAQRAIGMNSTDQFLNRIGMVAQLKPDVADKLDGDFLVDYYSDSPDVDPRIILPTEQAQQIRAERAAQQQQMQQAEMAKNAASAVSSLAQAKAAEGQ